MSDQSTQKKPESPNSPEKNDFFPYIDTTDSLLKFPQPCLKALAFCRAICCHIKWSVGLSTAEARSGKYEVEHYCACDGQVCTGKIPDCFQRLYRLRRKEDGACIYLGDDSKCTIYESRPNICRQFTCAAGWKLEFFTPPPGTAPGTALQFPDVSDNPYNINLQNDTVFMPNPLVQLVTLFYSVEAKELILIGRRMNKCITSKEVVYLDAKQLTDDQIERLYALFDGRAGMEEIASGAENLGISRKTADLLTRIFLKVKLLIPVVQ